MAVTIYTKDYCPYCVAAKNLLADRKIPYTEVKFTPDNDDAYQALKAKSGMRTVPQIFNGEELIGGFDSLSQLDQKDGLESLR